MNRYEFLADEFSNGLGKEFDIKYYENNQPSWSNMLLDNMIHGNFLITGGNTIKTGGSLIDNKQISIQFLIPIDIATFSKTTQAIDDYFNALVGGTYDCLSDLMAVTSYYRTDASKVAVNGEDYAIATIYLSVLFYDNAILSYESYVKIDNREFAGIINVVYSNQHATDGGVFGLVSLEQKNFLNSISQSITIDFNVRRNDSLHLDLLENADAHKEYSIEYYNGIVTRTYNMIVLKLDEVSQTGDIIKAQIVFGRGD